MSFSLSSDRRPNRRRRGVFRFYRRLLPQGLLPTGTGVQARERLIQLAGLALGALALATTLALLTFNASDPSLNTATARAAENWVGRPGAFWADLLLQGFGATAYLVPLLLLNWAVACLFRLERGLVVLRLLVALPALLMLAAVLSSLPFQSDWTKPSSAGGAGGLLVLENLQRWLFLPKAVSTVLCFVGGAIGMIFALGLERNLMPALGDPVGRERSRMSAAGGMDADGDGDGGRFRPSPGRGACPPIRPGPARMVSPASGHSRGATALRRGWHPPGRRRKVVRGWARRWTGPRSASLRWLIRGSRASAKKRCRKSTPTPMRSGSGLPRTIRSTSRIPNAMTLPSRARPRARRCHSMMKTKTAPRAALTTPDAPTARQPMGLNWTPPRR